MSSQPTPKYQQQYVGNSDKLPSAAALQDALYKRHQAAPQQPRKRQLSGNSGQLNLLQQPNQSNTA